MYYGKGQYHDEHWNKVLDMASAPSVSPSSNQASQALSTAAPAGYDEQRVKDRMKWNAIYIALASAAAYGMYKGNTKQRLLLGIPSALALYLYIGFNHPSIARKIVSPFRSQPQPPVVEAKAITGGMLNT